MSSPSARQREPDIESVFKTYTVALGRFFSRRIRAHADVEDLVQDVFFRLIRRGGVVGVTQIQPYLFHTANNVLKDYLRRRVTHHADGHQGENDALEDEEASPERVLIGKETVCQFAEALFELPERTRIIFVLSRFNELDYRTIAGLQGISVSAVEKHMAKALAHLVARVKV